MSLSPCQTLIAVTGSTGMIGRHIIEQLASKGFKVRVLQRFGTGLTHGTIDIVEGDLLSDDAIGKLLENVKIVFHCAAELSELDEMYNTNVLGTEKLYKAALDLGVEKFCYFSSAGVIGPTRSKWINESSPCSPSNMYERTKWEAEQALNRMALASSEVRLYVVRPTNVIDDFRSGLVGDMQKLTTLGRLKFMIKGGESAHLIHAADVASAAIYLTLSEEEKSGTYFIGCDEHIGNTVSGVLTRCKNMEAKSSLLDNFFLPAELIYWVRGLLKGPSLHGRSKFSSRKLLETGFSYPIGFEGIFERIRGVSEQKNNKQ